MGERYKVQEGKLVDKVPEGKLVDKVPEGKLVDTGVYS